MTSKLTLNILASSFGLQTPEFQVVDEISGGMGTCFKLKHPDRIEFIAMKVIQRQLIGNGQDWLRYLNELQIWFAASGCEGFVDVLCIERFNEIPCVCSPWMEGGSLRDRMAAPGLSEAQVYDALIRIVKSLAWLKQKHHVIHRDLKPDNILFDRDGLAYVADLGLAKIITTCLTAAIESQCPQAANALPDKNLTQPGAFLGTILYASPEQINSGDTVDFRSDIYSLGCIMYELETGRPPFTGRTAREIATKHKTEQPQKIGTWLKATRFGLEGIIKRCLCKKPDERYQSYEDLLAEIFKAAKSRCPSFNEPTLAFRAPRPILGSKEAYRELFRSTEGQNEPHGVWVEWDVVKGFIKQAEALMGLDKWIDAAEIYGRLYIPEVMPKDKWGLHHLFAVNYAYCLLKSGKTEESLAVLNVIYRLHIPEPAAEFYVNATLATLAGSHHEAAERLAKEGLVKYPSDSDLLGNCAIALAFQGKTNEALTCANKCLSMDRNVHSLEETAAVLHTIAMRYGEQDLPRRIDYLKKSLALLSEAKEKNPRFLTARYSYAKTLYQLEHPGQALSEFENIVEMAGRQSPICESSIKIVARIYMNEGCIDECLELIKDWLPMVRDQTELLRIHAIIGLENAGRNKDGVLLLCKESFEFFISIVDTEKATVEDFCCLALFYAHMRNLALLERVLEVAEKKYSPTWMLAYYRGLAYFHSGDNEKALASLAKACELAPYSSEPDWKASHVFNKLGDKVQADIYLERSNQKKLERAKLFAINNP